jgi:hypothetical protein
VTQTMRRLLIYEFVVILLVLAWNTLSVRLQHRRTAPAHESFKAR